MTHIKNREGKTNESKTQGKLVSIVVPAYNEEDNIEMLMDELMALDKSKWGDRFEFIIVDDGSTDKTWEYIYRYLSKEPRLTLVKLTGNRGAQVATRAGLAHSKGDVCIALSADLEEGIDLIEPCLAEWHKGKLVVMVVPIGSRLRQRIIDDLFAWFFYKSFKISTSLYGDLDVRAFPSLMDRVAVDVYTKYAPNSNNRAVFLLQQGFRYGVVKYAFQKRRHGKSKWTFKRRLLLALDMFIDASSWMLSSWRLSMSIFGGIFGIRLFTELVGYDNRTVDVWFEIALFGIVLIVLSIISIFVSRSYLELRAGPPYIIEEIRRTDYCCHKED